MPQLLVMLKSEENVVLSILLSTKKARPNSTNERIFKKF